MTHDASGDETEGRRWCKSCRMGVEPFEGDLGPECPCCGRVF